MQVGSINAASFMEIFSGTLYRWRAGMCIYSENAPSQQLIVPKDLLLGHFDHCFF